MQLQKFCISLKCSYVFDTYYSTRFPAARLMLLDLTTASDLPLFLFLLSVYLSSSHMGSLVFIELFATEKIFHVFV